MDFTTGSWYVLVDYRVVIRGLTNHSSFDIMLSEPKVRQIHSAVYGQWVSTSEEIPA